MNAPALRILAATKLLPLLLLTLPTVAQAQLTFTTNNGAITVAGYSGPPWTVIIPGATNGYPVTSIGTNAFYDLTSLTNVTIPDTVTNIGPSAFELCLGLKSLVIGSNVTTIGLDAFFACFGLTNVTLPNSVTGIGASAFEDCSSLTNITIGSNVTSIGNSAFLLCPKLTAITMDAANASYTSVAGVLLNKSQTTLIQYPGGKVGSYTIANTVTTIADDAFQGCTSLTGVTIPASVTSIGVAAFDQCTSLTGVTIPGSVSSIGVDAFAYCTNLTVITVDATNASYTSVAGVLFNKSKTTLIQYPGGKVGSYIITNSVTSIGDAAFVDCAGLTGITIPANVTSVGGFSFNGCISLTSVIIPDKVTSIGDEAFAGCASLTNVTIGSSVTTIGLYAFFNSSSLARVYFKWNAPTPTNDSTVFSSDTTATVYYVPGTVGWGSTFDSRPTVPWFLPNPMILTGNNPGFGVQSNRFGFIISWATNASIMVEASTNLASSVWTPVSTNTFNGGTIYFSDPQWTNYPERFYRLVAQP